MSRQYLDKRIKDFIQDAVSYYITDDSSDPDECCRLLTQRVERIEQLQFAMLYRLRGYL
jgi:hypothetical protein